VLGTIGTGYRNCRNGDREQKGETDMATTMEMLEELQHRAHQDPALKEELLATRRGTIPWGPSAGNAGSWAMRYTRWSW
ncbi:hypothetical protein RA265_28780, partial [Pseudomonas syringae pv. tagetis]